MKDFIAKDLFEDGARLRIIIHEITVDGEAACGRFLRHVQKGEETMIRLILDREIVETMAAGKRGAVEQRPQSSGTRAKEGGAALTEQIAVMQFVDGVLEIESTQQRVRCHLSRTQNVTSTVGLDFGKCEQFAYSPIEIVPDPPVNREQDPIQWRNSG